MFYEDTIAAIATSSKDGSISIIRISGPEAVNIVSNSFVGKSGKKIDLTQKQSHTIHFGYIKDSNGEVIDEVIVLLMKAPKVILWRMWWKYNVMEDLLYVRYCWNIL